MVHYAFLNTLGLRLSEDRLQSIPTPHFELFSHVTLKTVQGGAIIGGVVAAPITTAVQSAINKQWPDKEVAINRSYKYGLRGIEIGAVLGPILYSTWYYAERPSKDGVTDRCYRLRMNRNQVFSDRMCFYGLVAGAGIAKYLGEELGKGIVYGFTGGLLTAGLINTLIA